MKIRFPEIDFGFRIHPKPRGNWRPKVEMWLSVEVKDGELIWRPWVPGIIFGHPTLIEGRENKYPRLFISGIQGWSNIYSTRNYFWKASSRGGVYRSDDGENGILLPVLPDHLRSSPKKGDGIQIWGISLWGRGYWVPGTKLSWRHEFYLPWRPGQRPDYSDYARAFQLIPTVLIELWKDGLDSGVSDKISFEFRGRVMKKRNTPVTPKEGQGLTWM